MSYWISALKISLDWQKLSLSYQKWSEIEILPKKVEKFPVSVETRTISPFVSLALQVMAQPFAPQFCLILRDLFGVNAQGFVCNLFPFPSPFVERAKGSDFKCSLATIFWLNGDFFRYLEKITIFVTWTLRNLRKGATFCRWSRILGRILLFNSS